MSQFATQLKSEISRIAKKEIRSVKKLSKGARTATPVTASHDEDKSLRFRSNGFATLRKKLDLTASEMGQLLGVSGQSIYKWEQGKARPRASQLKAIASIRSIGKKKAHALLAE